MLDDQSGGRTLGIFTIVWLLVVSIWMGVLLMGCTSVQSIPAPNVDNPVKSTVEFWSGGNRVYTFEVIGEVDCWPSGACKYTDARTNKSVKIIGSTVVKEQ